MVISGTRIGIDELSEMVTENDSLPPGVLAVLVGHDGNELIVEPAVIEVDRNLHLIIMKWCLVVSGYVSQDGYKNVLDMQFSMRIQMPIIFSNIKVYMNTEFIIPG